MIGSRLAERYDIVSEIGRGGMGVVYLAQDPLLGREVAVKLIPPGLLQPNAEERFRREARVVARLDHPNIVSVYDFGKDNDSLFFVMPLLRGHDLRQLMTESDLPLGDIVDIMSQVASALDYAHENGIVHRDVKPENIFVEPERNTGLRARVTDFGLAIGEREARITDNGMIVGTMSYLAPEQLAREDVDGRADIYSLGVVLYECVTGRTPFEGDIGSMLYRIANDVAPPPSSAGARIPAALDSLILRCLEKRRDKRPQRASEVAEALMEVHRNLSGVDSMPFEPTSVHARPAASTLIDRERELDELRRRLDSAAAGEAQFVVVGGDAGVGKTRLVEEIERLAAARRIPAFRGRCVAFEESLPYSALCSIVQHYFRTAGTGRADFADLAPDLLRLFPLLGDVSDLRAISGDIELPAAAPSPGHDGRTQIYETLARTFIRMSGDRPMVLTIEDLHAAEVTIDALQYIVHRLGPFPILIIGTVRTDELQRGSPVVRFLNSFHGDRRFLLLTVEPFGVSEHRTFLQEIIGTPKLDEQLVTRTYSITDGNADFTRELVRSLIDSGDIARSASGVWRLSHDSGISSTILPASIRQAVEQRLERLPPEQRETLAVASVLGRELGMRELEAITDSTKSLDDIDHLIESGFLEEVPMTRGDRLSFSSGVVREVMYAALSRRRRRALHRAFAEWLERRNEGRLEQVYPQLLHHYAAGDVPDRAIEFGMKLAQRSLEAFADEAAIAAARIVLDFAEDNPIVSADARSILCEAYCLGGDIDRAAEEIAAAVRHLESSKDRRRLLAAISKAADVAWQGRRIEETRRWIDRALPLARELDDWMTLARLASLGATIANLRGDQESGVRYAAEAPVSEKAEAGRRPSGGIVHVPMIYTVASLDPVTTGDPWHTHLVNSVFETLTRTNERGIVGPWLAERFEFDDGGRSLRFVLRDDVAFHDGRAMTARDIRYSFERVLRRGGMWTEGLLDVIRGADDVIARRSLELTGVHIVSDRELVVETSEPVPFLPAVLTFPSLSIVPEGTEEIGHSIRTGCVGTGPFRVTRFEPGRWIELERNPHYWRPGFPRADGLVAWLGVRPDDIAPRFRSGRLSLAYDMPPADFHALRHDSGLRAKFAEAPVLSTCFLAFNMHSPALSDRAARERIAASLGEIASVVRTTEPHVTPATSVFPPGMLGYDPQPRPRLKRPVQRSSGTRVPLRVGVYSVWDRVYAALTRECLERFRDAGFDPKVDERKRMLLWDDAHDVDVVFTRWVYDYPDSDSFARSLLDSTNGMVGWACGSPELDQLIQRGRTERNRQLRNEIYRDIDEHLARETLLMPLFHEQTYCFARPEVDGLNARPFFPFVPFEELSITT